MHLGAAGADKRANSSFSHTKPPRFFVVSCIRFELRTSGFVE